MRDLEKDTEDSLRQIVEDAKGDREHAIDRQLGLLFEKVRPNLEREIDAVRQGATPIGFKPFSPENVERQAITFTIGQFFRRNFDPEKTFKLLAAKIPSLDPDSVGQFQDVQWAIDDVRDTAYDRYLPPR